MPSAVHLATNEPIFKWCFRLSFNAISGIENYIATSSLPKDAVNVVPVRYQNYDKTIAGRAIHQQHTFAMKGYVSPNTAAKMWQWWERVYKAGRVGSPGSYKEQGEVSLTDGRGNKVAQWNMIGCYPSQMDIGEGSYADPELVEIVATIEVDQLVKA